MGKALRYGVVAEKKRRLGRPAPGLTLAARLRRKVPKLIRGSVKATGQVLRLGYRLFHGEADAIVRQYRRAYRLPESRPAEVKRKADRYRATVAKTRFNRVGLYRELARLEQAQGNLLTACLYGLRAMRLIGADAHGDLPWVRPALEQCGFPVEARVAEAMYGQEAGGHERCAELLREALQRGKQPPPPCDFEVFDDHRGPQPIVSVICSLYNAAAKLPTFLQALQTQTLNRAGRLELILLDSASPGTEHAALRQTPLAVPIPYLYVRTPERETIQTAWNRGITLARAPYLAFLGVDEAVVPDALDRLGAELDADPALDWVLGSSLVTEVDAHGFFLRDVMPYDRTGYTPDHVYLETCYLSWVGALYRRSIHERFGYYDGSFRAAGDTEFKNRVLPFLKTRAVPGVLGVFLNYPDERTTASPRAEIEDLRAWYLHRTIAGVRYAFRDRSPTELAKMLALACGYRKSYCRHVSTDVEYAAAAARVLEERQPEAPAPALAAGVDRLLAAYRALDDITPVTTGRFAAVLRAARRTAAQVQAEHRAGGLLDAPEYRIHNDNRFEQHSDLW
jgi:glycosyltransferase involved in cell wall biosynthesis